MTLCVVAVCFNSTTEQPIIVAGADKRAETTWAGGNVAIKFSTARKNWPALIAGEPSKGEDFLATARAFFVSDDEALTRNNILDKFNEISSRHKEKLCQRLVRQQFGIDFERFLAGGEGELPAEVRARIFHEMERLEYGCDVLTFGFIKREVKPGIVWEEPYIIEVDRYGEVSLRQSFAAIGTGSVIAKSSLYQREHEVFSTLADTLYRLYEASKLAHATAPGVGEITEFLTYEAPENEDDFLIVKMTKPECFAALEEAFQQFGPKPVGDSPAIGAGSLRQLEVKPPKKKRARPSKRRKSKGQP